MADDEVQIQTMDIAVNTDESEVESSATETPSLKNDPNGSEPCDESIPGSCTTMLKAVTDYINGELSVTCEDYKLLERLNRLSINKYKEMSSMANVLIGNSDTVREKYHKLQPYLDQIDQLEESVTRLEESANKLDSYSKQLEMKFKKLEKR